MGLTVMPTKETKYITKTKTIILEYIKVKLIASEENLMCVCWHISKGKSQSEQEYIFNTSITELQRSGQLSRTFGKKNIILFTS